MTPELEAQLFEDIGAIKTGILNLNYNLKGHTDQDMEQFDRMTATIERLSTKVDTISKSMDIAAAVKADDLEEAKKIATRRTTIVSVIVSTLSVVVSAWIQHIFGLG